MIRDVPAGHKQVHFFPSVAFLHFKKKMANALICTTAQKQIMILGALQFPICDMQHMLSHGKIGCGM